jgi:ornithine cyclodeaminase
VDLPTLGSVTVGAERELLLVREAAIRQALDMPSCIDAVERAFAAYAGGGAELPGVIHLDVPDHGGEIHVKAGYLHGGSIYACKLASGFPGNAGLGIPPNDGVVLVFDAATGVLRALLLDRGCITDIRTGAAGGVAVRHLAPEDLGPLAILGAGEQSRQQLRALLCERRVAEVRLWARSPERAGARARQLSAETGIRVAAVASPEAAVRGAGLVVTVTASRAPLVERAWLAPGATVLAVGSDAPGKQELDPAILADADLLCVDSRAQCAERGELAHALARGGVAHPDRAVELGEVVSGKAPGRSDASQLVVCDLTGVGVQDVAAAALVLERLPAGAAERVPA